MRECATLFCKTKIDPYLYLERFIEVNKSFFVENAQVKFATLLLEADAAGGRDWDQYMRQMHAYWTGGQAGMTKEKSDISYSYNQAMKHIGNMLELVNQNPEADDPTVLRQVKNNLNKLKLSFDNVKPMIDNVRDRIMNVAVNKMQGTAAPLAGSVDMNRFKSLTDDKILSTLADMIPTAANDPKSENARFLNMVKNTPFDLLVVRGGKPVRETITSVKQLGKVEPRLAAQIVNSTGAPVRVPTIPNYIGNFYSPLTAIQKQALDKYFGNYEQTVLGFLKFKKVMGTLRNVQKSPTGKLEQDPTKIQDNKTNLIAIKNKIDAILNYIRTYNTRNTIKNETPRDTNGLIKLLNTKPNSRALTEIKNASTAAIPANLFGPQLLEILTSYNSMSQNNQFYTPQHQLLKNLIVNSNNITVP
jgi:hypothetical protein